jgi:hypothetical protein
LGRIDAGPDGSEWALYYAVHNYKVFPIFEVVPASDGSFRCACNNGVNCPDAGKHPRTCHGFHEATTGEEQISRWWSQWPAANIGIRTGDGQSVLDVDVDKGGDAQEVADILTAFRLKHGNPKGKGFRLDYLKEDDLQGTGRRRLQVGCARPRTD